mgnify:FL=1
MKKSSDLGQKIIHFVQILLIIVLIYSINKYFKTNEDFYIYLILSGLFFFGIITLFTLLKYSESEPINYIYLTRREYDELNEQIYINEKIIKEKNKRIKELKHIIDKQNNS